MIYYDRIYVTEGMDVNKTSASKECDVCHYCYFLNCSFKFQPTVCNRCHDLLTLFRMGFFGAAHGCGGRGEGAKRPPLPKFYHVIQIIM